MSEENDGYKSSSRRNLSPIDFDFVKAVDDYDWDRAKECLKNGADINAEDGHALTSAVWQQNLEMVKYLTSSADLEQHADIHIVSRSIVSMCINTFKLAEPTLEYLIRAGLILKHHSENALNLAAKKRTVDALKFLHEHGINLAGDSNIALHSAYAQKKYDNMSYILANGGNIHFNNEMLLRNSLSNDDCVMIEFLLANGASLHEASKYGSDEQRLKAKEMQVEKLTKQLDEATPTDNKISSPKFKL